MALRVKRYLKKSPYWIIRGSVAKRHIHQTSYTTVKKEAEAIAHKLEAQIRNEELLGRHPPATFADAAEIYEKGGGETKYLLKLLDYFGTKPLNKIGQQEINDAVEALYPTAKASTINRSLISPYITVVRSAIRAELPGALLRPIERRKESKPIVTPADDEHISKLLPFCSDGLAALIILMTYTGLRTGEALRVTKDDVKDGYVHVGTTKNGKPRMVPSPSGWAHPVHFGFGTTQGVGRALRKAHVAASLPYRDGHEIGRHAFAFRWLKNGGGLKGLMEAGNWETIKIVANTYGHLEQTAVHDTMRELSRKK